MLTWLVQHTTADCYVPTDFAVSALSASCTAWLTQPLHCTPAADDCKTCLSTATKPLTASSLLPATYSTVLAVLGPALDFTNIEQNIGQGGCMDMTLPIGLVHEYKADAAALYKKLPSGIRNRTASLNSSITALNRMPTGNANPDARYFFVALQRPGGSMVAALRPCPSAFSIIAGFDGKSKISWCCIPHCINATASGLHQGLRCMPSSGRLDGSATCVCRAIHCYILCTTQLAGRSPAVRISD